MEVLLRLDDEATDALALTAYSIEDRILNPRHYPLDDRDPLLHGRMLVDLARAVFGLEARGRGIDDHGLGAVARLFDSIELAMAAATDGAEQARHG